MSLRPLAVILVLLASSCLDPYVVDVPDSQQETVVVEGSVDIPSATGTVRLSHLTPIGLQIPAEPERQATVTISNTSGRTWSLPEVAPGTYRLAGILIDATARYSLRVKTSAGVVYQSTDVAVLTTPPIDSISYKPSNDGKSLVFSANTHDDTGVARNFSWSYEETYEYNAPFFSQYILVNGQFRIRRPEEVVYKCWRTSESNTILTGSSKGLNSSVVRNAPLVTIPRGSSKTSLRYSLLVRQRAVSEEEYNYLTQLKVITENLGGLFDPMPYPVKGNIFIEGKEGTPVPGFFSVSQTQETRFFVTQRELPDYFQITFPRQDCIVEVTCDLDPPPNVPQLCVKYNEIGTGGTLINATLDRRGNPVRFSFTTSDCADCTTQGGVTQRPDFW